MSNPSQTAPDIDGLRALERRLREEVGRPGANFDIEEFYCSRSCNTTACVAGWAASWGLGGLTLQGVGELREVAHQESQTTGIMAFANGFGISLGDAMSLCMGDNYPDDLSADEQRGEACRQLSELIVRLEDEG